MPKKLKTPRNISIFFVRTRKAGAHLDKKKEASKRFCRQKERSWQ